MHRGQVQVLAETATRLQLALPQRLPHHSVPSLLMPRLKECGITEGAELIVANHAQKSVFGTLWKRSWQTTLRQRQPEGEEDRSPRPPTCVAL